MNQILTSNQAAELLGINRVTLCRWVKSGVLRGQIVGPRKRIRVKREDVLRLRDSWTVAPPQPDFKCAAANDQVVDLFIPIED